MGTRERRTREKQERREDILKTARKLFSQAGYEGTTMPQIAAAAELAPGTLYLYFPSKDALYAELLLEGLDLLAQHLRKPLATHAQPWRQAASMIDAFFRFAKDYPEYFSIIFFLVQREGRATRDVLLEKEQREQLAARQEACLEIVSEMLVRAGYSTEHNRQNAVQALWSMLVGVTFYFLKDDSKTFSAVVAEARRLILRAIFLTEDGSGRGER